MSRTPMFQLSSDLVDRVVAHMPVLGTFAALSMRSSNRYRPPDSGCP